MSQLTTLAVLAAATLTDALANAKRQSGGVEWVECEFDFTSVGCNLPYECGKFTVPLDYTDDSNEATLDLDLIKVKATHEPSMGCMLFNPGGPGASGVESVPYMVQELQIVSGGYYDLIGFDPRGTGRTIPLDCGSTAGLSVEKREGSFFAKDLAELLDANWPGFVATAENCSEVLADTGRFYGTAFVARDMVQIIDALEQDGLLRYYGKMVTIRKARGCLLTPPRHFLRHTVGLDLRCNVPRPCRTYDP